MALREAAVRRGLHVSEYGILDDATGDTLRCATEEEVYSALGLQWIPPELREGRGELEAAGPDSLPDLIKLGDLRGDLHSHTTMSDGTLTAEEMARAAQELGLEYLAITDHSATHGFGDHVTADQLRARIGEIRELNEQLDGFQLLIGTESNILPDGSPDYPDELLADLDWVIASIHTSFGMGAKKMTDRLVAAIEHTLVDAIGHPTGRKIEKRQPYELDMDRVIEAAARTGTMIEINASPDRRDLNDIHARAAAQAGVRILVNSDAHSIEDFHRRPYGIATARAAAQAGVRILVNSDAHSIEDFHRRPYGIATARAAAQAGVRILVNSDAHSIEDFHRRPYGIATARAAAQAGVRILVNSDAHSIEDFHRRPYGIATARAAWPRGARPLIN